MAQAYAEPTDTTDEDGDEIEDIKADFRIHEEAWEENRRDFIEDIRFGREEIQWPEEIRRQRELDGRPCLTLNQLHTFIFQVINSARQNKPGIIVHPVGSGSDPEVAELFNGLIRHIEQSSDGDVAYDTGMDNAVSGGFGFWRVNTRYTCDDTFEQDITLERIFDAASVYPDAHSTAADSQDWNRCHILFSMAKKAFETKYKGKQAVSFDGEPRRQEHITEEEMVQLCERWTREEVARPITALAAMDPMQALAMPQAAHQAATLAGDKMIVDVAVYEANQALFDVLGMKPVGKPRDVKSYKVTQQIVSGADVLETLDWAGTYIPIVPVWGEELSVEGKRKLRSLIRGSKDAQRMYNYWKTTSTELVALAPKTPFIGKKGSFDTDAAKWATSNTEAHAYIEYDGADAPTRQPFASVPTGAIQEAASAQADIKSIIGIFNSSIGAPSNETSGVAIDARDKQADTGSFHFTDNLSRAMRHCGRILLDLIPKVYSTARVLRILQPDGKPQMVPVNQQFQQQVMGPDGKPQPQLGPDGQPAVNDNGEPIYKTVAKMFDLTVGKYDLVVKAGPSFATQRDEIVQMCTEIIRVFPQAAPVLADIIFRNYDMPGADDVADRLYALMPQQAKGDDPRIQEGVKLIQSLQQKLAAVELENKALKGDKSADHAAVEVKAYEAQTKRIVAMAPEGMPQTPEELNAVVLASVRSLLADPDALLSGMTPPANDPALTAAPTAPGLPEPNNAPPPAGGLPAPNNEPDADDAAAMPLGQTG
jgi:hypothetical protein